MNRAAFLEAIVDRPDDDAPRLIYADWLEEHGDPQGTFIRLQCVLEQLADDDSRRQDFEEAAEDLLASHVEEWTASLKGTALQWRFRRGFVEWIAADGESFLTHMDSWFDALPLRGVQLHRLPPSALSVLVEKAPPARLESLDFQGHFLRDREVRELVASPLSRRLKALHLHGQGIETPGIRALTESAVMPQLRLLDLSGNQSIGDQAARVLATASSASALHALSLSDTNVTLRGVTDLVNSTVLGGLRELNVAVRQKRQLAGFAETIAKSPVFANLLALDLSNHAIQLGELQALLTANKRHAFRRLKLANCDLGSAAAEVLAEGSFEDLVELDLNGNRIGSSGLTKLAACAKLASLRVLRLNGNEVRDTGTKALASSNHLTYLTTLDLAENEIGGPGLRALTGSANVARIQELDLSKNYVNRASIESIAGSPHLARLRMLKLNGNRLGDADAKILSTASQLHRRLTIERTDAEDQPFQAMPRLGYGRRA
jgi:uncharacterized protein (TIGR02996 family)